MNYIILKRHITDLPEEEDIVQYWLFEVSYHEWIPYSFSEDPIWWWFTSEDEARETLWWTLEIVEWVMDFTEVADVIHQNYLSFINGQDEDIDTMTCNSEN